MIRDIDGRPIALMGCGLEGHKLYYKLVNEGIKINYVVDNKRTELFWGMNVVRPEEIINHNPYFLISSEKYYDEIKNQLLSLGLKEFDDFIKGGAYNKKIVVINANCYGPIYKEFLNSSIEFIDKFFIYDDIPFYEIEKRNEELLNNCDLCLTQNIEDTERNHYFSKSYICERLKPKTQVITIPNLVGFGKIFYPQYDGLNEMSCEESMGYGFFKYKDKIIDEFVKSKKYKTDNLDDFKREKIFDDFFLEKSFYDIIGMFKEREKLWDIKIIDDILRSYKEKQMFYDPQHPVNEVFEIITIRILKMLNIDVKEIFSNYHLGWDEMPIYPDVAKYYGLMWWSANMEIRKQSNLKFCKKMFFKEYVTEYVSWCYQRNNYLED